MGGVRGIILDSSVLMPSEDGDASGDTVLSAGADSLLRKLRYSGISVGVSHEPGLSSLKECRLEEVARTYSCNIFCLSQEDDISIEVARIWEDKGGSYIHVVSNCREEVCRKESGSGSGWLKVIVGSDERKPSNDAEYVVATRTSSIFIDKLEELPLLICHLNKEAMGKEALTVGYVMKPSREEDFAKRGAFPLCPTQNGLIFLPLNYELPMSSQLQLVDAVLHKATDEILAVDMHSPSEFSDKVTFTRNLQELQRYIKDQTDCCVIDPFNNIFPILDRLEIQKILIGLETLNIQGHGKVRAPHFLKVDSFDDPNLTRRLVEAKLSLPNIVKPQVACGVSDAHSMAIVFNVDHYKDLNVPLPAVVQEYVDHSSLLYKFYALGSKIFYAVKKSIPNADTLMNLFTEKGLKPLHFDSLKSLPVAKEQVIADNHQIDLELVNRATEWLRRKLDLTIFGFDVVVQEGTGDHVIVDVNYLPSFKEVPDDVAVPAFWDALKEKIVSQKSKQARTAF
ncbi:Inositol-1,3,4-trisphosphate 5/6-kinase [Handroanthus impetiginosus]|uniref:inositol-1,3,4-trisphosphate 5/6-kinase n=1 Tax=Handroanthus impetiginosus TaxID=429701 RepID=A0A2G9G4Y9_9LAMI|nr:Inositol-1,3,4-trisphosphate 5/6-kinase [Handroanthus impetiginosus]